MGGCNDRSVATLLTVMPAKSQSVGRHDVIRVLEAARATSRVLARRSAVAGRDDLVMSIGALDRQIRRIEDRLASASPEDLARFVCDMETMTARLERGQTPLAAAPGSHAVH
jgi:hypothetical protein